MKNSTLPFARLHLQIPVAQKAALLRASKETGAPLSELVRRAIERAYPSTFGIPIIGSKVSPDVFAHTAVISKLKHIHAVRRNDNVIVP